MVYLPSALSFLVFLRLSFLCFLWPAFTFLALFHLNGDLNQPWCSGLPQEETGLLYYVEGHVNRILPDLKGSLKPRSCRLKVTVAIRKEASSPVCRLCCLLTFVPHFSRWKKAHEVGVARDRYRLLGTRNLGQTEYDLKPRGNPDLRQ